MKRFIQILLGLSISFSVLAAIPVGAAEEQPFFLLGQNQKTEVVFSSGKPVVLELGKNPLPVLTGSKGQKLFLCAGEEKRSGEISEGASLRLMAQDFKSYEKTVQCDSALTGYAINNDISTIWLATQGGTFKKDVIKPKISRVDLDSFIVTEAALDSLPCQITLSSDGKWLAVACVGEDEKTTSVLTILAADTLKPAASFDIVKNPGLVNFSDDNMTLVVASYGYQEIENVSANNNGNSNGANTNVKPPTEHYVKLKKPTPAGVSIIDLASLQSKQIELGLIKQESELRAGANATIYNILKDGSNGIVKAVGPTGLLWEKKCDFVPQYIQERPGTTQVFIISGKRTSVIDKQSGNTIKEITAANEIAPLTFIDNSSYAYSYSMNNLKLHKINLDKLEIEETMAAGSAGLAAFKTAVVVASFVAAADSMQPHYVNGVQIPTRTSSIYWVHSPKGNIVACPEKNKLYMLNSFLAEIYTYDMQKGVVAKKLGYLGQKTLYLQMAPSQKYVILVAGDNWMLVNTVTDKADLTFSPGGLQIGFAFQEVTAPTPYFSPDGNKMYIPKGSKVMVIDLQKGKQLTALNSQTKDAMVCW